MDMKNNKTVIRLTESDIHGIVSESVRRVLSELDWKTYANASRKSHDRAIDRMDNAEEDRAWRFADASNKAFNKEFGHDELDDDLEYYGEKARQSVKGANFTPSGHYGVGMGSWTPLRSVAHKGTDMAGGSADMPWRNSHSQMRPSSGTVDAYSRAGDEIRKYVNGKYRYEKGSGWE